VHFGKHKGKTLPQIVLTDPDWFFWAVEQGIFNRSAQLKGEASDVRRKARRIKGRGAKGSKARVEYVIHPHVGKLADVSVVSASSVSKKARVWLLVIVALPAVLMSRKLT